MFKNLLQSVKGYFSPTTSGTSGFWGTPVARGLASTQQKLQQIPRRQFTFADKVQGLLPKFGASVAEEFANIPSKLIYHSLRFPKSKTPQETIANVAGMAEPLLDIATLGVGSQLVKQAGKQTIKEFLKRGAKEGAKYGTTYGMLRGLVENKDAPDVKTQFTEASKTAVVSGALGAPLGAGLSATGYLLPKAIKKGSKLTKEAVEAYSKMTPVQRQAGFLKIGDILPKDVKKPSIEKSVDDLLGTLKFPTQKGTFDIGGKRIDEIIKPVSKVEKFAQNKAIGVIERSYKNIRTQDDLVKADYNAQRWAEQFNYPKDFLNKLQKVRNRTQGDIERALYAVQEKAKNKKIYGGVPIENKEAYLTHYLQTKGYTQPIEKLQFGYSNRPRIFSEPSFSPKEVLKEKQVVSEIEAGIKSQTQAIPPKPIPEMLKQTQVSMENRLDNLLTTIKGRVGIKSVKEASDNFNAARTAGHTMVDELADEIERLGYTQEQFVDIVEGKINAPKNLEGTISRYQKLLNTYRTLSEKKDVGTIEKYFPREPIDSIDRKVAEIFPETMIDNINLQFGFSMPRTGALKTYPKDVRIVIKDYVDQALTEKYRPFVQAKLRGVSPKVIEKEAEIGRKIGEQAKQGKLGDDAVDLFKEMDELAKIEAKTSGKKQPEKILVTEKLDFLNYLFRDGWTNLKNTKIWMESFAPLARLDNIVGNKFTTLIKPALDSGDLKGLSNTLYEMGIEGTKVDNIMYIVKANLGKKKYIEEFLTSSIKRHYRNIGSEILNNWIKTHTVKDGLLTALINFHAKKLLSKDVIANDFITKATRIIQGRFTTGALALNARAHLNNLFEPKRAVAAGGTDLTAKGYYNALKNPGQMRKLYGVEEWSVEQFLAQKYGSSNAERIIKYIDDKAMASFRHSEGIKDDVFLFVADQLADRKGLTGDLKFNFVMDFYERFAHKYGQFGTVGIFNNKLMSLAFQFSQYTFKDWGLLFDMAVRAKRAPLKDKEATMYLLKWLGANSLLYGLTNMIYGARFSESFAGMPSVGPVITSMKDISDAHQREVKSSKRSGEEYNIEDVIWNPKVFRDFVMFAVPGGNQLINKTGQTIGDILRGYRPTYTDRVMYLAPQTVGEKAVGLVMGPSATPQAREYWEKDRVPLSKQQSQTFKQTQAVSPETARTYYEGIHGKLDTGTEEKKQESQLIKNILSGNTPTTAPQQLQPVKTGGLTINDIILKRAKEKEAFRLIEDVLVGRKDEYKNFTPEQKQIFLQAKGVTPEIVKDYYTYELRTAPVEDRAAYIMQQPNPDFANLYKLKVLTPEVAKELERNKNIADADDLMDKLKLTDPYYYNKAMENLKVKSIKSIIKTRGKTIKGLLRTQGQALKSVYRATKRIRTRKTRGKRPKLTMPKLINVPPPKPYKVYIGGKRL